VLRLLRGEDLETVSRSLGVTAAALSGWRDVFLAAGEAGLATRPIDGEAADNPPARLHIGEATDGHAPLLDAHGPAQRGRAARCASPFPFVGHLITDVTTSGRR
jgi:transposase